MNPKDFEKIKGLFPNVDNIPSLEVIEALQNLTSVLDKGGDDNTGMLDEMISIMTQNIENVETMRKLGDCFQESFRLFVEKNPDIHISVTVFSSALLMLLSMLCEIDFNSNKPVHLMENRDGEILPVTEKRDIMKLANLFRIVGRMTVVAGIRIETQAANLQTKYENMPDSGGSVKVH